MCACNVHMYVCICAYTSHMYLLGNPIRRWTASFHHRTEAHSQS